MTPERRSAASDTRRCQMAEVSAAAIARIAAISSSVEISPELAEPFACERVDLRFAFARGRGLQAARRPERAARSAARTRAALAPGARWTPGAVGAVVAHRRL